MTSNPPRALWAVLCQDVDGSVFVWTTSTIKSESMRLARFACRADTRWAREYKRPRRRYWVEAYDRREQ